MSSELIFYSGLVICGISVTGAVIAAVLLRIYKSKLDRQLDDEYGKRKP